MMTESDIESLRQDAIIDLSLYPGNVYDRMTRCLDEIERLRRQRSQLISVAIRVADVLPQWSRLASDIEVIRAEIEPELPTLEDVQRAYAQDSHRPALNTETTKPVEG